mgnify:CR=1 FL=1
MARILAVDDERAILDALARVLGRDGHEVVKAADPTAVPGMDLSRFDLVLCDVMMPGLDGFELVRQIRPDFDGPIVFLTARVAEEDAVAGYGLGADDYVRKPFGAAELRAKGAAFSAAEVIVAQSKVEALLDLIDEKADIVIVPDGTAVVLDDLTLDENALRAAIDATGYTAGEIHAAPYEKNGLFSFLKK